MTTEKEIERQGAPVRGEDTNRTRAGEGMFWWDSVGEEAWPEAVEGGVLLDELAGVLRRFVILPQWAAETLGLWVLHTYAFELRDVSTYIGIESPEKRCGKTTLLAVLSELVNRPVVAANISPPAFFRVIEETNPTLLIDEADTFLQGNDELRGILNSGYSRKTAYVVRVSQEAGRTDRQGREAGRGLISGEGAAAGGGSRLARFSCWCPKVMATIGRLPDTLADRCIVIRMHRKLAKEGCERLRTLDARPLRRRCARFVADHREEIGSARPSIPAGLNDRAADIWEPLLALADLAGGRWPELAREAAVAVSGSAEENNQVGALLLDIFVLFVSREAERLFSRTLVEGLVEFGERPWRELGGLSKGAPRPVTELWLARQLRPYGIRPRTVRIGETVAKGYVKEDFREAFRRYIPKSEIEELVRGGKGGVPEREKEQEAPEQKTGSSQGDREAI